MTAMSEAYEQMTDTAEQERVEDEAAEMEHYCRWSEGVAGKLEGKYGGGDPEAEAPVEIAAATYLRKLASEVRRLRAPQREGDGSCRICNRPTDGVTLCRYCDRMMEAATPNTEEDDG